VEYQSVVPPKAIRRLGHDVTPPSLQDGVDDAVDTVNQLSDQKPSTTVIAMTLDLHCQISIRTTPLRYRLQKAILRVNKMRGRKLMLSHDSYSRSFTVLSGWFWTPNGTVL
jgi:hypothetical protein